MKNERINNRLSKLNRHKGNEHQGWTLMDLKQVEEERQQILKSLSSQNEDLMEDISIRQDWCPLRPLPERMDVCGKYPELVPLYRIRWNECLDKITEN